MSNPPHLAVDSLVAYAPALSLPAARQGAIQAGESYHVVRMRKPTVSSVNATDAGAGSTETAALLVSHPERTSERVRQLDVYMRSEVLAGDRFVCRNYEACKASSPPIFIPGQLSHVGRNYDLEDEHGSLRIVVVGQEYGSADEHVSLADRRMAILGSASAQFYGRNPHMKGTTSLLRLLHGRDPGDDFGGEELLDGHLFDGFALVNYLLCSALHKPRPEKPGGSGSGASSNEMRRNCARHFLKTLEILEPDVVIAQGIGVRGWIGGALGLPYSRDVFERVPFGSRSFDLLSFSHPSARGDLAWGRSVHLRYLQDVVRPTVAKYLAMRDG